MGSKHAFPVMFPNLKVGCIYYYYTEKQTNIMPFLLELKGVFFSQFIYTLVQVPIHILDMSVCFKLFTELLLICLQCT